MSSLVFLLGFVGGGLSTFFFLAFLFLKLQEKLDDLVHEKEEKFEKFMKNAKETDPALASRPKALCQIVRFENNVVGSVALPVRADFLGETISLRRVDPSFTTNSEDSNLNTEQMIGKINANTVISSSEKISKFHRHTDITTRSAPVKGKCLVLRQKGDLPVIQEDPALQLTRRTVALIREERKHAQGRFDDQRSCPPLHTGFSDDGRELKDGTVRSQSEYFDEEATDRDLLNSSLGVVQDVGGEYGDKKEEEDDFAQWKGAILKLPTRREHERWFNLLQATPQSDEWCNFVKRIPHNDVFNLLVARLFFENQRTQGLQKALFRKVRRKLRKVSNRLPKHMHGSIVLDTLAMGGEIPLISNVSEPRVSINGELDFDFDVLYRGGLSFGLRVSIKYHGIRVPDIVFHVSVLEIASRMRMSIGSPPSAKLWIGSSALPQLRLELTQQVTSQGGIFKKIVNILPDMSSFMTYVVKVKLFEDMVLPKMEDLPMPSLSYTPPSSPRSSSASSAASAASAAASSGSSPPPPSPPPRGTPTAAREGPGGPGRPGGPDGPDGPDGPGRAESVASDEAFARLSSAPAPATARGAVGEGRAGRAGAEGQRIATAAHSASLSGDLLRLGGAGMTHSGIQGSSDVFSGSDVFCAVPQGSSPGEPWQKAREKPRTVLSSVSSKGKKIKKWFKDHLRDKKNS